MAFNPFHSFRRHQKVIFAVMAIVCMVLFVLSSGAGGADLLNQITEWVTGRRAARTKDTVATLDGKNIDGPTYDYTQRSRKLANSFVTMVVNAAHSRILDSVFSQFSQLDPTLQRTLQEYVILM